MNSEELELSLRTEFESYLKGFLAEFRQEVSEFQKNFDAEFEKHRSQTDEAVRKLVERFDAGVHLDRAFNETVVEHLRLARDEGATLTATAIGEAEKLKEQSVPSADFDKLRDAINDISSKGSQSEILKLLVDHASHFAPRGAFFIVKNEHFVGWRAFGEGAVDEDAVRSIQFPMSADTILADAITKLGTVAASSNTHAEDDLFLETLKYGSPDRMYAIPLVARGRGVAVLYADFGADGVTLNPEALETLVRVAGLTVELAAAAVQPVAVPQTAEPTPEPAYQEPDAVDHVPAAPEPPASEVETAADEYRGVQEFEHADVQAPSEGAAPVPSVAVEEEAPTAEFEPVEEPALDAEPVEEEASRFEPVNEEGSPATGFALVEETPEEEQFGGPVEVVEEEVTVDRFGEVIVERADEVTYFEPVAEPTVETEPVFAEPVPAEEYVPVEPVDEFPEVIEEPAREVVPVEAANGFVTPAVVESPVEVVSAPAARTKYRDRNVELPIEVPEDERRLHNDARRFARLLVSEIKLYNEQKVAEGRERGDLYDRLREAIDRSRDMYDKRVQQPVADKFDYFHFELVSSLADGEDVRLGASYPGSKVPA